MKIVGEPNFDKLHILFRKLKANAAAVPCTLAGGANGYLGMLVSRVQYTTVAPGTPFVAPLAPGPLDIDPTATQYQIMLAKTQYETVLREHQTYILLQRSLISLVQNAIANKYTNAICNRITGQLPADIRLITNHLFNTYGEINESVGPISGTCGPGRVCVGEGATGVVENILISSQREWFAKTTSSSPSYQSKHSAFSSTKDGNLTSSSAEGITGCEDDLWGCGGSNPFKPAFI